MFTPSHLALLPTLDTEDTEEVKREAKLAARRKAGSGVAKKKDRSKMQEKTQGRVGRALGTLYLNGLIIK